MILPESSQPPQTDKPIKEAERTSSLCPYGCGTAVAFGADEVETAALLAAHMAICPKAPQTGEIRPLPPAKK